MKLILKCAFAVMVLLAITASGGTDDDLNGAWYGPDGVTHSVRQVGMDVWWVARSGDGGRTFTSVFHGKLVDDALTGEFADVPEGRNLLNGSLKAKLVVKEGKVASIEGELRFSGDDTPKAWSISRTEPGK